MEVRYEGERGSARRRSRRKGRMGGEERKGKEEISPAVFINQGILRSSPSFVSGSSRWTRMGIRVVKRALILALVSPSTKEDTDHAPSPTRKTSPARLGITQRKTRQIHRYSHSLPLPTYPKHHSTTSYSSFLPGMTIQRISNNRDDVDLSNTIPLFSFLPRSMARMMTTMLMSMPMMLVTLPQ